MKTPFPSLNQAGIFALATAVGMVVLVGRQAPFPIVTHHHVRVLHRVEANKWWMEDDEDSEGFLYTGCGDFPNESVIWEGYIAREARWQERGACKSIQRSDLGFWWLRDDKFNARRIDQ